ncbi:MAG: hypothetical protein M3P51_09720, partial [Chloroflexota bacterium]|nr:hypothetical protein [Chloroflexota bacterium]
MPEHSPPIAPPNQAATPPFLPQPTDPLAPLAGGHRAWLRATLVVVAFSALLYGPWLLTAGFAPRGDVLRQSAPWLSFAREQVWAGRLPAWDPSRLAGTPHLANIQAGFFYPPNLLLLAVPADVGSVLSLFGHVALGGVLLTLLGRSLGLRSAPAALAGAAYVAGGFVTARVFAGHLEVLRTMAWTPLLLLAAREMVISGRARWAGVLAASSSLSLLAGYPAVTVYSLGAAGVLFLATLQEGRGRIRAVLVGAVAMCLTPLVCAPALWPLWELARETTRSTGLDLSEAAVGALRPSDLPTLLWPWYFGSGPLESYWRGPGWFWHETQTAGDVGVSVLALVGVAAHWRDRRVWLLVGLGVGSLLLSLGTLTPAYTLLHEALPFLRLFRIPARFSLVWSLVIPLLAGLGLQGVLEHRSSSLR